MALPLLLQGLVHERHVPHKLILSTDVIPGTCDPVVAKSSQRPAQGHEKFILTPLPPFSDPVFRRPAWNEEGLGLNLLEEHADWPHATDGS